MHITNQQQGFAALEKEILHNDSFFEVDHIDGNLMYLKGYPYPYKGVPTIEALEAVNRAKSVLKAWAQLPLPWRFNAAISEAWTMLRPYQMPTLEITSTALWVWNFVLVFNKKNWWGYMPALIIQYDAAYRFRLMDLASETSTLALTLNPRKEIARLIEINRQRDYPEVSNKIRMVGNLVRAALLWPPWKRAFIHAIQECPLDHLVFDEIDRYWACHKKDYNYFGKTYVQRQWMIKT